MGRGAQDSTQRELGMERLHEHYGGTLAPGLYKCGLSRTPQPGWNVFSFESHYHSLDLLGFKGRACAPVLQYHAV